LSHITGPKDQGEFGFNFTRQGEGDSKSSPCRFKSKPAEPNP
jgi:hypothetical protein